MTCSKGPWAGIKSAAAGSQLQHQCRPAEDSISPSVQSVLSVRSPFQSTKMSGLTSLTVHPPQRRLCFDLSLKVNEWESRVWRIILELETEVSSPVKGRDPRPENELTLETTTGC